MANTLDDTYFLDAAPKSSLVSKNITILGRRTSVRLEPEMWTAIFDIAKRESCTIHELCSLIHLRKRDGTSLTAAIRVFLMLYFRAASNEDGHVRAGHGNFENMKKRARVNFSLKEPRSNGLASIGPYINPAQLPSASKNTAAHIRSN